MIISKKTRLNSITCNLKAIKELVKKEDYCIAIQAALNIISNLNILGNQKNEKQ